MAKKNLKEFRINHGFELTEPQYTKGRSVFTISDPHFNHANIIKYCKRPFNPSNVAEMNRVLIKNWNYTVKPKDYVFFCGDMSFNNYETFVKKLNGKIFFIRGNHDKIKDPNNVHDYLNYVTQGLQFRFTHNPEENKPVDFDGWTIHGHLHNNYPDTYPFYDPGNKTFNVSVEMVNYYPVNMQEIIDLIESGYNSKIIYRPQAK
jgi:calcineurin-like phosphoesterase family protein